MCPIVDMQRRALSSRSLLLETVTGRPSLLHLCMRKAATCVLELGDSLNALPIELAEIFFENYLGNGHYPSLLELQIFCEAFWSPQRISLSGVEDLSSRGLDQLSLAPNLLQLDLSGCSWLDSLSFLPGLVNLRCVRLKDCWRLSGDCLAYMQQLPQLQCVDVENVYSITDSFAARYFPGMRSLVSLNVSGTGVGDGFLEALTYGCRLKSWSASEQPRSLPGVVASQTPGLSLNLMQEWPSLGIRCLSLQHTLITQAALSHLLYIENIMLLDVRSSYIKSGALAPLQAKYGLVALPNNSKLLARSNSVLVATLGGKCGCSALNLISSQMTESREPKLDWVLEWEHNGFVQLLKESSRVQKRRSQQGNA